MFLGLRPRIRLREGVRAHLIAGAAVLLGAAGGCEESNALTRGATSPPAISQPFPLGASAPSSAEPPVMLTHEELEAREVPGLVPSDEEPVQVAQTRVGFLGRDEAPALESLARGNIKRVKKGKGGRSLAFKLTLEDGSAGYYKPEQTFSGTIWFAEVAAYALDRALGIGRVPPVVSRRIPWSKLALAAEGDDRVPEIIKAPDNTVRGAMIAWLEEPLTPAVTPPGWENWIRVEPFGKYNITPFQRASEYVTQLELYKKLLAENKGMPQYYDVAPVPSRADLPGALSDMITLDFLLMNIDRFGGDNGNVLTLGEAGPLIFLDNAAGLSIGPHRRNLPDQRFFPCQRFRKATIDALEKLDVGAFGAQLERDSLGLHGPSPLTPQLIEGIAERRKAVLEHVTTLRRKHGDAAVLSL
jgi:hypothetical protein